jgi:hypothetical protein
MRVFCTAFLQLQFGFVLIFLQKYWQKAACKMLLKLTTERLQRCLPLRHGALQCHGRRFFFIHI